MVKNGEKPGVSVPKRLEKGRKTPAKALRTPLFERFPELQGEVVARSLEAPQQQLPLWLRVVFRGDLQARGPRLCLEIARK